jgi:hypothetical protein
VHGLARLASDILFQSELLFSNAVIGSFVGLAMTISMPLILEFLYQNVLDPSDWEYAQGRLTDLAAYEEVRHTPANVADESWRSSTIYIVFVSFAQTGNVYKSVQEAKAALRAKELAGASNR